MSEDDITPRAGGKNLAQKVNVSRRNGPKPSGGGQSHPELRGLNPAAKGHPYKSTGSWGLREP